MVREKTALRAGFEVDLARSAEHSQPRHARNPAHSAPSASNPPDREETENHQDADSSDVSVELPKAAGSDCL